MTATRTLGTGARCAATDHFHAEHVPYRGAGWGPMLTAAEDLAALDRLLDTDSPHSILRRDNLSVRSARAAWAARRT